MRGESPNPLQFLILACLAAAEPKPLEMMAAFNRLKRDGSVDLLVFALAVSDLEEHGFIRRVEDTEEKVTLALEEKGRKSVEVESRLDFPELQQFVRMVAGKKARHVC